MRDREHRLRVALEREKIAAELRAATEAREACAKAASESDEATLAAAKQATRAIHHAGDACEVIYATWRAMDARRMAAMVTRIARLWCMKAAAMHARDLVWTRRAFVAEQQCCKSKLLVGRAHVISKLRQRRGQQEWADRVKVLVAARDALRVRKESLQTVHIPRVVRALRRHVAVLTLESLRREKAARQVDAAKMRSIVALVRRAWFFSAVRADLGDERGEVGGGAGDLRGMVPLRRMLARRKEQYASQVHAELQSRLFENANEEMQQGRHVLVVSVVAVRGLPSIAKRPAVQLAMPCMRTSAFDAPRPPMLQRGGSVVGVDAFAPDAAAMRVGRGGAEYRTGVIDLFRKHEGAVPALDVFTALAGGNVVLPYAASDWGYTLSGDRRGPQELHARVLHLRSHDGETSEMLLGVATVAIPPPSLGDDEPKFAPFSTWEPIRSPINVSGGDAGSPGPVVGEIEIHVAWVDLATAHVATPRAPIAEVASLRNARLLVTARSAQIGSSEQLEREHAQMAPDLARRTMDSAGAVTGTQRGDGVGDERHASVRVRLLDGTVVIMDVLTTTNLVDFVRSVDAEQRAHSRLRLGQWHLVYEGRRLDGDISLGACGIALSYDGHSHSVLGEASSPLPPIIVESSFLSTKDTRITICVSGIQRTDACWEVFFRDHASPPTSFVIDPRATRLLTDAWYHGSARDVLLLHGRYGTEGGYRVKLRPDGPTARSQAARAARHHAQYADEVSRAAHQAVVYAISLAIAESDVAADAFTITPSFTIDAAASLRRSSMQPHHNVELDGVVASDIAATNAAMQRNAQLRAGEVAVDATLAALTAAKHAAGDAHALGAEDRRQLEWSECGGLFTGTLSPRTLEASKRHALAVGAIVQWRGSLGEVLALHHSEDASRVAVRTASGEVKGVHRSELVVPQHSSWLQCHNLSTGEVLRLAFATPLRLGGKKNKRPTAAVPGSSNESASSEPNTSSPRRPLVIERINRGHLAEAIEFDVSGLGGAVAMAKVTPSLNVSVALHTRQGGEQWAQGDNESMGNVLCVANYRIEHLRINRPRDVWTDLIDPDTLEVVGELRLGFTICDPNRLARDLHRDGGMSRGYDGIATIPRNLGDAVSIAASDAKQLALLEFGNALRAQLVEAKAAFRAPLLRATLSGRGRGVRGALIAEDFDATLRQAFRNSVACLHPRISSHDVVITNVWDTTHGIGGALEGRSQEIDLNREQRMREDRRRSARARAAGEDVTTTAEGAGGETETESGRMMVTKSAFSQELSVMVEFFYTLNHEAATTAVEAGAVGELGVGQKLGGATTGEEHFAERERRRRNFLAVSGEVHSQVARKVQHSRTLARILKREWGRLHADGQQTRAAREQLPRRLRSWLIDGESGVHVIHAERIAVKVLPRRLLPSEQAVIEEMTLANSVATSLDTFSLVHHNAVSPTPGGASGVVGALRGTKAHDVHSICAEIETAVGTICTAAAELNNDGEERAGLKYGASQRAAENVEKQKAFVRIVEK